MRIPQCILLVMLHLSVFAQDSKRLELANTIYGNITPKSIIYSGNGYFFAQNMMYSHKITVYDRNYSLVRAISDKVKLDELGFPKHNGAYQGAPVEAAFSDNGRYVWVTNYRMYGEGFDNPGNDTCGLGGSFDNSFIYRIDTKTFQIDAAVKAGCVPKYIAITHDNRYALVSNWCSGDLSVIDISLLKEIKRIPLGLYPRGIAVDSKSQYAYVAIMGSDKIAKINLTNFTVSIMQGIGKRPRHLCISSGDKYLYASLNKEHKVVKIDLGKQKVVSSVSTGHAPRSMTLSPDGHYLYVVNYITGSLSVITTHDMLEIQNLPTNNHPIGVAFDPETNDVWVACYSGSIQIFKNLPDKSEEKHLLAQEQKPVKESRSYQYHIVVGAFRDEQNLKRMISKCANAGYDPYIINPGGDIKKLSCMGFDSKESTASELSKAKDVFGEDAWLLKQPMTTEVSR